MTTLGASCADTSKFSFLFSLLSFFPQRKEKKTAGLAHLRTMPSVHKIVQDKVSGSWRRLHMGIFDQTLFFAHASRSACPIEI
jgi:hypothetical protein